MQLSQDTEKLLIMRLLGLDSEKKESEKSSLIGKICMFRTYSAGVHFGTLKEKNGKECVVEDSHRVFYWSQACSLSQLAMEGSKNIEDCKISMKVDEILLTEVIEIIPMPHSAFDNLTSKIWKK